MNIRFKPLTNEILVEVGLERLRQDKKWGIQRHDYGTWLAILVEEVGEVAQAMQPYMNLTSIKETDADDLYNELIQVAAVASAIAEQVLEERMHNEKTSAQKD